MSCKFLKSALLAGGASLLMAGAANAGIFKVQTTDVDDTPNIDDTTGEVTLEKSGHIISSHRKVSPEHPFPAHVEIELFEIDPDADADPFAGGIVHVVEIELLGTTNPVWKQDFTPGDIIRDGTDDNGTESASAIVNPDAIFLTGLGAEPTNDTGFGDVGQVQAGTNTAFFTITPNDDSSESAIGFSLPVALTNCDEGDTFNVRISIRGSDGSVREDVTGVDEHPDILACEDPSFEATFVPLNDQKVEYDDAPLNSRFIVPEDGFIPSEGGFLDGFTGTTLDLVSTPFGFVNLSIKNQLTSVKFEEGDDDKYDDVSDIVDLEEGDESIIDMNGYRVTFNFKDTTGLAAIEVYPVDNEGVVFDEPCAYEPFPGTPALDFNFVLDLSDDEVEECFVLDGDDDTDVMKNGKQDGVVMLRLVADGEGGIVSQSVDLVSHVIELHVLDEDVAGNAILAQEGVEPIFAKYEIIDLQEAEDDVFRIIRNGLQFGPFDWVTIDGRFLSVFRVSGLPPILEVDEHDQVLQDGVERLRGVLHISNSSRDINGFCEFDLTDTGRNLTELSTGETLFNAPLINDITGGIAPVSVHCSQGIIDARATDPVSTGTGVNFGRADILFSWFLPARFQQNVDMDRLLNTSDSFADFGDNGNDAFSVTARSCDPGRFGSNVLNRISGLQADILSTICLTGSPITGFFETPTTP